MLASFPLLQGVLLVAELLSSRRLCLPEQLKPILRVKKGWGQRSCVGVVSPMLVGAGWTGPEEPMEPSVSLRRGRKCARRSTASLGLAPA